MKTKINNIKITFDKFTKSTFGLLISFGSFTGIKKDNDVIIIGKINGEFISYIFGPFRFTKV